MYTLSNIIQRFDNVTIYVHDEWCEYTLGMGQGSKLYNNALPPATPLWQPFLDYGTQCKYVNKFTFT